MTSIVADAHSPSFTGLAPEDVSDGYWRRGLDVVSDARLSELVAGTLARPKVAPADSFVLHAPLELLARTALLPFVEPQARDLARQRLVWLGSTYAAAGDEVGDPVARSYDGVESAVAALTDGLRAGDLDEVDAVAGWLAGAVTPSELSRTLADCVLPHLSAAAHGPILLFLLPRAAPRSAHATRMARGLLRELARHPDWCLTWHRRRRRTANGSSTSMDLIETLGCPPSPGDPGSNFIFPTMSLVEQSGLAAQLLDEATQSLGVPQATRDLLRTAAWSMVQDDPDQAPYGWSHCLTMPQAALGIAGIAGIPESGADPEDAVAVAATYVLGFRATQGRVALDPHWIPELPSTADPLESLTGTPSEAASGAWHAPESAVPATIARLATQAATHPDAHLAKYTLACLDASNSDPDAGRLYLAAAAYLGAWWGQHQPLDDPLRGRADRRGRGPSGLLAEGEQERTSTVSLPFSAPTGDENPRGGRLLPEPVLS